MSPQQILVERLEQRRLLIAGDLDNTFDKHGVFTQSLAGDVHAPQVAVQSDGETIVTAMVTHAGTKPDFVMERLSASGRLDRSFGVSGKVEFTIKGGSDVGRPLLDSKGRILVQVAGRLTRFTAAGKVDGTFHFDSHVPALNDFALRGDDKIIAVSPFSVQRLLPDGKLDTKFGNNGRVNLFSNRPGEVRFSASDPLIQHDGGIIVTFNGGVIEAGEQATGGVARITSAGKIDRNFGDHGFEQVSVTNGNEFAIAAANLPNGGVAVLTAHEDGGSWVTGLDSRGAIAPHFGVGGVRTVAGVQAAFGDALLNTTDRKLIVVSEDESDVTVARLNEDGKFDPTFGGTGKVVHPIGGASFVYGAALGTGGDVTVATLSEDPNSEGSRADLVIGRIKGAPPALPLTLAKVIGGVLVVSGTSGDDAIAIASDGDDFVTAEVNGKLAYFARSGLKSVQVDAGAGNDGVNAEELNGVPATIDGGAGDDVIDGGQAGNLLIGGAGNDFLNGGQGNDTLLGGDGKDELEGGFGQDEIDGGAGNDRISDFDNVSDDFHGGDGIDSIDFGDSTGMDLRISLDNHDNDGQPREHDNVRDDIENVTTGEGNDLIIGSAKSNVLDGVFGNDTIIGGAGPDTLIGGPGDDELLAKDGFVDVVNGVDGNDRASVDNGKVKDQVLNVEVFI
jgi:uncharacterized delta-60 repeat protein